MCAENSGKRKGNAETSAQAMDCSAGVQLQLLGLSIAIGESFRLPLLWAWAGGWGRRQDHLHPSFPVLRHCDVGINVERELWRLAARCCFYLMLPKPSPLKKIYEPITLMCAKHLTPCARFGCPVVNINAPINVICKFTRSICHLRNDISTLG